jgi:hypothetical protein
LFIAGISINIFAQDGNPADVKRLSCGGALSFLPEGGGLGGALEFGFLIFHNEKWDIRNYIFMSTVRIY